ncbi:complement C1q domain-containing protein [Chryseobacterium daecheongense]|uniref:C1q domain-containing protein n=1 Tax=Chryseobacterium daecheongense TaxID=192389 RepID=A0A3N0VVG7_9FLAO|nr:hypothetical protein [Chryseobacterium daecheongense]ROH95888.1 hypothetical protein EGI05_15330 [Chryseobacterium daecheongense]TDX91714.1 hypothetical protein BCF50_2852 [Chryseobacterium daecheongense]
MKNYITLLKGVLISGCLFLNYVKAQVGINTSNPQATFHIDGAKDNPTTGSPTSTQIANDVAFTSSGEIGIGTLTPATKLDVRSVNNTDNSIGIGETTQTATAAEAGAMRYNPLSGGKMQYSDGIVWQDLISTPTKAVVVANIQAANFAIKIPYQVSTGITGWSEISDPTTNFNNTTGVFTAPRTGVYLVSFTYDFVRIPIVSGYFSEARYVVNGSTVVKKCVKSFSNTSKQAQVAGSCVAGVQLNKGDTFQPQIYQSVYNGNLSLRTDLTPASNDYGFINLSIVEQ